MRYLLSLRLEMEDFLKKAAQHSQQAIGVDISDQRDKSEQFPENTSILVYDGYDLSQIEIESVDFVFSDQLIEHLHDEDVEHHFTIVNQILKKVAPMHLEHHMLLVVHTMYRNIFLPLLNVFI